MIPVTLSGFEDVLPLLILFGIWWASSRKRKARKTVPPPSPEKKKTAQPTVAGGGQAVNPLDVLKQMVFGDLEIPRPMEPKPRSQPPDEPMPFEYANRLGMEEEGEEVPVAGVKGPVIKAESEDVRGAKVRTSAPAKPKKSTLHRKPGRRASAMQHASRRNLRQAVVWSEILAPPVGLREG